MASGSRPLRLVVVDDDPMVCAHLRTILCAAGDIDVVDEAYDGAAAVEAVIRHRPDLVLMDLRMPGLDGVAATGQISALSNPPAVVALTTFDLDEYVIRAMQAGAVGFLLKSTPPQDLVGLVRVAAEGHTVLSPAATRRLLAPAADRLAQADRRLTLVDSLTDRETDVLDCLGEGLSNAEIARRLHLTEATVKGYVSQVLSKLQCANRTQAGLIAASRRPG